MPLDLLLYIAIAAVLIFWLRNILGTRHGDERQRPNPITGAEKKPAADGEAAVSPIRYNEATDILIGEADLKSAAFANLEMADDSVAEGLSQIMKTDRAFDPVRFVAGAKDAFAMIVEAFADGDLNTLQGLLAPNVYNAFENVIEDRKVRGETVKTEVHAVRKAEVMDARLVERMIFIKLKFTAQETCVVRDREGAIISGNPDRITEMTDVWTFGRDSRSKDPTWLLYETSDDVPEDEKTPIPDAK